MHPKDVVRFIAWSKAMVAGATVGKPNYGKTSKLRKTPSSTTRRRRRRRRRKRNNGSKD